MNLREAFWDASAIVPLCVRQAATSRALKLYRRYSVTAWWATPVEAASALARLHRLGDIDAAIYAQGLRQAAALETDWTVVAPSRQVLKSAQRLLGLYPLRAADALQLAAALAWCEDAPAGEAFVCGDQRLCDAAQQAGFTVEQV